MRYLYHIEVRQYHHNAALYYAFQGLSGLHFIIKKYPKWPRDSASGILGLKYNFFTWIINFIGLRKNTFAQNTNRPADLSFSEDFYRIYFPNNEVTLARKFKIVNSLKSFFLYCISNCTTNKMVVTITTYIF